MSLKGRSSRRPTSRALCPFGKTRLGKGDHSRIKIKAVHGACTKNIENQFDADPDSLGACHLSASTMESGIYFHSISSYAKL